MVESDISRSTPTLPNLASSAVVRQATVDRRLVELEVSRVHHVGDGSANEDAHAVGNRVIHREEVEAEVAERDVATAL